jgi:hypothetical protein
MIGLSPMRVQALLKPSPSWPGSSRPSRSEKRRASDKGDHRHEAGGDVGGCGQEQHYVPILFLAMYLTLALYGVSLIHRGLAREASQMWEQALSRAAENAIRRDGRLRRESGLRSGPRPPVSQDGVRLGQCAGAKSRLSASTSRARGAVWLFPHTTAESRTPSRPPRPCTLGRTTPRDTLACPDTSDNATHLCVGFSFLCAIRG